MTWAEYQAGYNQCSLELMRNMSATTTATPIQPNDLQMHGKIFTHVPIGYHGNTHVSSHPPTFILPNSTAPLPTSPVSLTTGKIPAVVWVPIPSPPPSPSNKTTLGTQPTVIHKTEHKQPLVEESQSSKTKTSKTPSLSTPTMWRPWWTLIAYMGQLVWILDIFLLELAKEFWKYCSFFSHSCTDVSKYTIVL